MTESNKLFQYARTHRVGKRRPGELRLWMIEEAHIWKRLREEGHLYGDPDWLSWFDGFPVQNEWLRQQLAQRLPNYQGHYPWMARVDHKPDLRFYSIHLEPGTQHVRMELSMPPERAVLFDHCHWFAGILNRHYIFRNEAEKAESDAWEADLAKTGLDTLWYSVDELLEPLYSRLLASWERIFDIKPPLEYDCLWVAFERLDLADVVEVTEFTTRDKPKPPRASTATSAPTE